MEACILEGRREDVWNPLSSSRNPGQRGDVQGLMLGTTLIPARWKSAIIPLKSGYRVVHVEYIAIAVVADRVA